MLRTMQKARYAPENLGHFGLAASSYTHFTSPIRRYPDLVVHRALRAARHETAQRGAARGVAEDLPEIARHTSEMERRADDAERELLQWKKVKFMADKVGDEFEGYVTGVAAFGLFIELIEHFVEGLVHVSTMADDYYRFVESAHMLRGENTQKAYRLGDKVKVQVIRVNMDVRQIDLGLVEILERVREGERGPRRAKARPKHERPGKKSRPGRRETAERRSDATLALVIGGVVLDAVLEVLDRAADALAQPRQPVCAENDDDDRQNDQQFWQSDSTHGEAPSWCDCTTLRSSFRFDFPYLLVQP